MTTFRLTRIAATDLSTLGDLRNPNGDVLCVTLERGTRNPDHVRIPVGKYRVERKSLGSSHFDNELKALMGKFYKGILWLSNVPGRTDIECHPANFYDQLLGCIALGTDSQMLHGQYMVGQSKKAYANVYPLISGAIDAGETFFEIIGDPQ